MADFPLFHGGRSQSIGGSTTTSTGTSLLGTPANTKGSWTQLVASSGVHTTEILVLPHGLTSGMTSLLDIGVGASGSETVVIPDFLISASGISVPYLSIPISIPAGSRVAARLASSVNFGNVRIACILRAGALLTPSPLSIVTAYGVVSASSRGTQVDPGTTANTLGAWVQVVASTTNPCRGLFGSIGYNAVASSGGSNWLLDIAVGASGSEITLLSQFPLCTSFSNAVEPCRIPFSPVDIPAGSRLAVRAQCSSTTSDRLFDVALYGVN